MQGGARVGGFPFRAYLDAWNEHDGTKVAEFMADDVIYEDVAMGLRHEGKAAVAAFVAESAEGSEDFGFELVSEVVDGTRYAVEWIMRGTNTGEVAGLPATGKSFSIRGSSVGELDGDGHIAGNRDYWNLADLLMQVGILPAADEAGA
jgi:steroid delta-isomerase-like uncharacterized protein